MLRILEAEVVGDPRDIRACSERVFGTLNNILADVIAGSVAGHLFPEISEIFRGQNVEIILFQFDTPFLYSLGVQPVIFLNHLVKCWGYGKPRASEIWLMLSEVVAIRSFATSRACC